MTCSCIHNSVCIYRIKIMEALDRVIEANFGGRNPKWIEAEGFVSSICRFREHPTYTGKAA